MQSVTQAPDDAPTVLEVERDWFFTFGHGQRGISVSRSRIDLSEPQPHGFRLDDRYVRITGSFTSARERMVHMFGQVWCGQYESAHEAGVDEYKLTELVLTKDWQPGGEP